LNVQIEKNAFPANLFTLKLAILQFSLFSGL
jgi:hypothetical protein